MYLPRLVELGENVRLIPCSGIQFLDVGCKFGDAKKFRRLFYEDPQQDGSGRATLLRCMSGEVDTWSIDSQPGRTVSPDDGYSIDGQIALDTFTRAWIPVPVFRIHEQAPGRPTIFMNGPTAWARLQIVRLEQPDDQGNSHRLVFAFDTSLARRAADSDQRPYVAPLNSDSDEQKTFRLVDDRGRLAFFCNLPFVDEWLAELHVKHRDQKLGPGRRFVQDPDVRPRVCEHWARYLTLIDLLTDTVTLPTLMLAGTMSAIQSEPPIKVDLVLDIGNSRTCGILIERDDDRSNPSLANSYPLELRDLSRPERIYADAFESRLEFAKADFGNEQLTMKAGRANAFTWYSMVRTGVEALDLCISAKGGEGATGLSSPKRYLWDEEAQPHMWRFNMSLSRHAQRGSQIVDGPVMAYVAEDGRVLSSLTASIRERDQLTEAFEPHFSRCSLFTFMLQEILLHAFVQINSVANRAKRPKSDRPRKLDKIVLTLPPGMPLPERRRFEDRARAAVSLMWDCLAAYDREVFSADDLAAGRGQFKRDKKMMPTIVDPYDEASSTQIVYLYAEILRLQNGMQDLLDAYGRERPGYKGQSLRIASIDIGGGTTDLMVITHEVQNRTHITPYQNFRESFRVAGDDILRQVINSTVLPSIEEHARAKGILRPEELTGRIFGADKADMSEPERQKRRQLVVEVITPIGLDLLTRCEEPAKFGESSDITRPIGDFFAQRTMPSSHILDYIDKEAERLGGKGFRLIDVPIQSRRETTEREISGLMSDILANLGEVVRDLDCDIVLLSGRPSRLPLIRDLVVGHTAVTPDRVVSMSGYRVGNWYPFRDNLGQIADPKTTTAVGAVLSWLARGDLGGIKFESSNLRLKSTARYIGALIEGSRKLPDENVIMHNIDLDAAETNEPGTVKMANRLMLGYRQLPFERWPAMPLYELSFRQSDTVPLDVKIARRDARLKGDDERDADEKQQVLEEFVLLEAVTQRDGTRVEPLRKHVDLRLQTLPSREGYWVDTGVIKG